MTKTIDTLVADIYNLFEPDPKGDVVREFSADNVRKFGERLADHIHNRIVAEQRKPSLRLSAIGTECQRKLWYSIKEPEKGEKLSGPTRFKFLFGDILEELLLFLAEEAGHSVEGRQTPLTINGVKGHRDAIIDGRLVDCKSASTYSYNKFKSNGLRGNDPFGYLDQLGAYLAASDDVKEKDVASFLVVDKTLGNICLDTYPKSDVDYGMKVEELKAMLELPEPPPKHYEDIPEGKSGNRKLGTNCSYCPFKYHCWPEVRTFLYSNGPVFLTHVEREPKVIEVDKNNTVVQKEESYQTGEA